MWNKSRSSVAVVTVSFVLAIGFAQGCGVPASERTGGAGGVVTLGPSPIGGDGPGSANANDNAAPPADGNDNEQNGTDDGQAGDPDNANDNISGGAPFANACEAVTNRNFAVADRTLAFSGSLFSWITSGGQIVGVFTCDGFDLLGISSENEQFVGSYDPRSDTVTWQGTIYLPVP